MFEHPLRKFAHPQPQAARIHIAVATASGNGYFEAMSICAPCRPSTSCRSRAIEARDKDAAQAAMRRHIENTCKRVFEGPGAGGTRTPEWSESDRVGGLVGATARARCARGVLLGPRKTP